MLIESNPNSFTVAGERPWWINSADHEGQWGTDRWKGSTHMEMGTNYSNTTGKYSRHLFECWFNIVLVCRDLLHFHIYLQHTSYGYIFYCIFSFQWPTVSLQRLDDSSYKLFVKRVLYFYKPSSGLFANVELTNIQAQVFAQALLHFCDFLLGGTQVMLLSHPVFNIMLYGRNWVRWP